MYKCLTLCNLTSIIAVIIIVSTIGESANAAGAKKRSDSLAGYANKGTFGLICQKTQTPKFRSPAKKGRAQRIDFTSTTIIHTEKIHISGEIEYNLICTRKGDNSADTSEVSSGEAGGSGGNSSSSDEMSVQESSSSETVIRTVSSSHKLSDGRIALKDNSGTIVAYVEADKKDLICPQ